MHNFDGFEADDSAYEYLSLFAEEIHDFFLDVTSEPLSQTSIKKGVHWANKLQQFLDFHASPSHPTISAQEINYLFERFIRGHPHQRGLKLQFGTSSALLLNEFWVSMDLAPLEANYLEDREVTLAFPDEQFDRVLCLDLDCVSQPVKLVAELRRVLKRGGQLWGQAPVAGYQPLAPDGGPRYWGFTPEGLRVLFERFDEIRSSVYQAPGYTVRRDSFYYGLKPEIPSESAATEL